METKNKIPIWENKKDYLDEIDFIVSVLLGISDRDYQMRIWCRCEGPEVSSYVEATLTFDEMLEYLKHLIREKKVKLTEEQIKAILRTNAMCNTFDRILLREESIAPKDWTEEQIYLINHPYWIKVTNQAKYALSLLRKSPETSSIIPENKI